VAMLSQAIGKPIKIIEVSVEAAVEGMRKNRHMPPKLVDAMGEMLQAIRDGKLARKPTHTVQEITGKSPRSFKAWCESHKEAFL
jgi:hypothetical protein